MALILIIDSTTSSGSLSLIYKKILLKNITYSPSIFIHIKIIHLIIRKIFKYCNLSLLYLKALAFNFGPGSYTSLKIGLAASIGFGYGLNIKLIYFKYPSCVKLTNKSLIVIKDKRTNNSTYWIINKNKYYNLKKKTIYKILKSNVIKTIYLFNSKRPKMKRTSKDYIDKIYLKCKNTRSKFKTL
jgi:hypothetical protein